MNPILIHSFDSFKTKEKFKISDNLRLITFDEGKTISNSFLAEGRNEVHRLDRFSTYPYNHPNK